ncbi:MAG: VWA domain-containing protein [Anaerolineae bacterium]
MYPRPSSSTTIATFAALLAAVALAISVLVPTAAAQLVSAQREPDQADPGCVIDVDKVAGPSRVILGDLAFITLTVQADCERLQAPVHAVLVMDNSLDMGGTRMGHMRDAVMAFADELGLEVSSVGLVSYHGTVEVLSELTSDRDALEEATRQFFPHPGSNLLGALASADNVLDAATAESVLEVVVVLSGSLSDNEPDDLIAAARALQDDGRLLVTVAGTGNADIDTLEAMASSPAAHHVETQSSRYVSLYQEIARDASSVRVTGAEVTDRLPANMEYAWGSGVPAPRVRGDTLQWSYAVWPTDGLTITYAVEPAELGAHATNVEAAAEMRFERGGPVTRTFPVPTVVVIEPPTATPVPPTATPTAEPTRPRLPVYLPLAVNRACAQTANDLRVAVLVDTSLSTYDRTTAGGVKLEYIQIAATDFVGLLNLPRDVAAVIVFGDSATVTQPLTGDRVALEIALGRVYGHVTRGSMLAAGLAASAAELARTPGEPGAEDAVVLVSDGIDDSDAALAAAADVRRTAKIYAIGIGPDISPGLLARLAGSPDRAFVSADGADLGAIYAEVARRLTCGEP